LFIHFIEAAPRENNMYPYGPQQNDDEYRVEDSPYFSSYHCLRIDTDWTGFLFFSERHYKLHVSINIFKMTSGSHINSLFLSVYQTDPESDDLFS